MSLVFPDPLAPTSSTLRPEKEANSIRFLVLICERKMVEFKVTVREMIKLLNSTNCSDLWQRERSTERLTVSTDGTNTSPSMSWLSAYTASGNLNRNGGKKIVISDIILILSAYLFKKYSVMCIFFWLSILLSWKSDFFFTNRRVPTKGNNSLWGPWIPFSRLVYVVIKHTDVSVIIWQAVELKNIYFKLRTLTHKCPTCS